MHGGQLFHFLVAWSTVRDLFTCAKDLFVEAISVVIEPAPSLAHARMRASLADLDQGEFTEGHELDRKWRVPKAMIGRRLTQAEAKRLLARFG